ncbi:MAG: hypothetical protein ACI4IG_01205 [Eubacterium sp.]
MKNIDEGKLNNLATKANINIDELKKATENGNVEDYINKNLSSQASAKLKDILNDKSTMEKMLSTPEAKALLDKLMKK